MQATLSWSSKNSMALDPFASRLAIGDEEWREKIHVLDELQAFVNAHAASLTSEHLNALVVPFRTMFCELRSAVVKKACDVFSDLAQLLRQKAKNLVDKVFQALMEARGGSNKVNSQAIHCCIESVLHVVVSKSALTSMFYTFKHTKNGQIRDSCMQYLWIVLTSWTPAVLEALKPRIQECILIALSDASPVCREVGRTCYGLFVGTWPEKKLELQAKLSPTAIKYLAALNFADKLSCEVDSKDFSGRAVDNSDDAADKSLKADFAALEKALQESKLVVAHLKAENESLKASHQTSQLRMRSLQTQTSMLETLVKEADVSHERHAIESSTTIQSLDEENQRLQHLLASAMKQVTNLSSQLRSTLAAPQLDEANDRRRRRLRAYSMDTACSERSQPPGSEATKGVPRSSCHCQTKLIVGGAKDSLSDDSTALSVENARLRQDMAVMAATIDNVNMDKAQLQDRVDSLLKQAESLDLALQEVHSDSALEQTKHLNMEAELTDKIQDIEHQLKAATLHNKTLADLLNASASKEATMNDQRTTEVERLQGEVAELAKRAADLEADRQNVLDEIDRVQADMTAKLARKDVSMDRLKSENRMLQMKVESLQKSNEELQSVVKITEDAYYQMKEDVSSQSLEEVETMAGVKAENESLQLRIQNLLKQLDDTESINDHLRDLVAEARNAEAEIDRLKAKLQDEVSQSDTCKYRADVADDMVSKLRRDLTAQLLAKDEDLMKLTFENQSLQNKVDDLVQENDELKSCIKFTEDAYYQIQEDVSSQALDAVASVAPVKAENESLQSRVNDLLQELDDRDQVNDELRRELQRQHQSFDDESSKVQERIRSMAHELSDVKTHLRAAMDENNQLRSDLCSQSLLDAETAKASEEANELLQLQVQSLHQQVTELEALVAATRDTNQQLQADLEDQSRLKRENDKLRTDVEALVDQIDLLKSTDRAAADSSTLQLKEELMILSAKAAEAQSDLKRVLAKELVYQTNVRDLEVRVQVLEHENAQVQAELAALSSKHADVRAKLKFENQCLQGRVESLQRCLDDADTSRGLCDMDISMQDEFAIDLTQREMESPSHPLKPTSADSRISPDVEENKTSVQFNKAAAAPLGASRWNQQVFAFREKGNLKAQRQLNDTNLLKRWKPSP